MMDEYERRLEAIGHIASGETVSQVCADLKRTRAWYYKWRRRYRTHGLPGLRDQRSGHPPPQRTPLALQHLIIETRDRLVRQAQEGLYHLGIGAKQVVVLTITIDKHPFASQHALYLKTRNRARGRHHEYSDYN